VLHGRDCRPHGPEWKALMRQAGFEPRVRIPAEQLVERPRGKKPGAVWEHRCPVCQMVRMNRRRVPRWRCAACREAGLEGKLIIKRHLQPGRADS